MSFDVDDGLEYRKTATVKVRFATAPGVIHTLEGDHSYELGDAIAGPGAAGEFWPIRRDIFAATYALAAQVPAQEERLRSLLTLAHDHHAFGPEHCTPANCSVSEALAEYRALGDESKEEPNAADVDFGEGAPAQPDHEHYWVDAADDETGWHCTICGVTEYPEPPFGAESVGVEGAGRE